MKKKDLILGAGIIVIALAMLLVMQLTRGEEGNQIRVTLDGKIYGTYSLSKDQTIEVKDGDFYNRIRIEDGKAYMADNDFKCCSGSCAEAFAKLNNGIYYHDDSAVYVNLYVPSKVHWADKKVGLEQAGGFPVEPIVDFTVSVRRPVDFVLNLFIPAWTDGAVVYVNGEKQEMPVRPSSFLKLSRRWADGDRVRIEFRYAFRLQSMPDKENMLAVFYGPMLLAFETRDEVILKGNKDEILAGLSFADSESGRFVLKNGEREFRLRPLFDVDKESYGVYATIRNY